MVLTFPVELPANTSAEQVAQWLSASGFTRVQAERELEGKTVLDVVADRFRIQGADKQRALEAIELSLKRGSGRLSVYVGDEGETLWRFSTGLTQGDGRQASHWRDDAITGTLIGVMDPTLASGIIELISPADRRALDVIGWDFAAVAAPEPAMLLLLGVGAALRARRRRA